jgi:hypothetical protein
MPIPSQIAATSRIQLAEQAAELLWAFLPESSIDLETTIRDLSKDYHDILCPSLRN